MDIATLGLEVTSTPVAKAAADLDKFATSADKADTAAKGVVVRSADMGRTMGATGAALVNAGAGASRFDGAMRQTERTVTRATSSVGRFAAANDNAATSLGLMSWALARMKGALSGIVPQMIAFGAATFGLRAAVTTLASFEHSMAQVDAIARPTAEELARLRDVAKELGATTEFSSSQAAEALRFLGMAGFSASQSIAAIPAVLDLSTAASMDLARAADIASNIMSAFGIAAENASAVADVLAAAASRANTDVYQLGDAMKYVGPVAAAMGIPMNDAAAAVGTLSDAGIQGSMAGTGLRRILSSLVKPTGDAASAIAELGIKLADVNPRANTLASIVQRLTDRGLDAASAFRVFGDRGGPAILALVENNDKLQHLTRELQNVEGAAATMAGTMRDNLMGDFKDLSSAAESVVITVGEAGVTGALRASAQTGATVLRALAENMDTVVKVAQVVAAGMVAAFGPAVLGMVYSLSIAIATRLVGAFNALTAAMMRNPIIALATILATVITALYTFVARTDSATEATNTYQAAIDKANGVTKTAAEQAAALSAARKQEAIDTINAAIAEERLTVARAAAARERAGGVFERLSKVQESGRDVSMGLNAVRKTLEGIDQIAAEAGGRIAHLEAELQKVMTVATADPGLPPPPPGGNGTGEGSAVKTLQKLRSEIEGVSQAVRAWDLSKLGDVAQAVGPWLDRAQSLREAIASGTLPAKDLAAAHKLLEETFRVAAEAAEEARTAYNKVGEELIRRPELMAAEITALERSRGAHDDLIEARRINAEVMAYEAELLEAQRRGYSITADEIANLVARYRELAIGVSESQARRTSADRAANESIREQRALFGDFMSDMRYGLKNGESAWSAFADAATRAMDRITEKLLDDVLDAVLKVNEAGSKGGGGGGILGALGNLVGVATSFFAPTPTPTFSMAGYDPFATASMPGFGGFRAGGGPVEPGKWYTVGERGREAFAPQVPGRIIPNDALTAPAGPQQVEVLLSLTEDLDARIVSHSKEAAVTVVRRERPGIIRESVAATYRANEEEKLR